MVPLWSAALVIGLVFVAKLMQRQYKYLSQLGGFLPVAGILAIAACIAENSCISWYKYYEYSADWGFSWATFRFTWCWFGLSLFSGNIDTSGRCAPRICCSEPHFASSIQLCWQIWWRSTVCQRVCGLGRKATAWAYHSLAFLVGPYLPHPLFWCWPSWKPSL